MSLYKNVTRVCRTTGSMYFCGNSGTTPDWRTRSIQMTLWTSTPPCWTPFGNPTCSLLMKREPTFTRSRRTTSCFGYSRTETSFTASGDGAFFFVFLNDESRRIWKSLSHISTSGCTCHLWASKYMSNMFVSAQFSSVVTGLSNTHWESKFMLNNNCRLKENRVSRVALKLWTVAWQKSH